MSQYSGVLSYVSKYSSGVSARGEWSVQVITIRSGSTSTDIKVWGRPDLTSAKGKLIEVDGVTQGRGKDRGGNEVPCLELRDVKGSTIVTTSPGGPGQFQSEGEVRPAPQKTPASGPVWPEYSVPSRAEYEGVLAHAIAFVAGEFSKVLTPGDLALTGAVAEVVKGYMVAYVKGDFQAPKPALAEEHDPDIPF